jgi:Luciferase-like monooxygenase
MQIGVFVPNVGASANPRSLVRAAQHAEALGFDSIWVADRLLFPVAPRSPSGARAPFVGSLEQLREDVARTRAFGAAELIFQIDLGAEPDQVLAAMDRMRALCD